MRTTIIREDRSLENGEVADIHIKSNVIAIGGSTAFVHDSCFAKIENKGRGFVFSGGLIDIFAGGEGCVYEDAIALVNDGGICNVFKKGTAFVYEGGNAVVFDGVAFAYAGSKVKVYGDGIVFAFADSNINSYKGTVFTQEKGANITSIEGKVIDIGNNYEYARNLSMPLC